MSTTERRADQRLELTRPCKVFDPRSGRYLAGRTWNLSRRAVLLELEGTPPLRPGDRVLLAVAFKRRQGVLARREMIGAEVVRLARTMSGATAMAVQLDEALRIEPWPAVRAA